ncbi:uncharacterized protein AAGF69_000892 isoform 2-T7 [Amazona ochrocephala]
MAAAAARSGAGGRAGCSWPQPGVRAPAPVPPARRFGAAWRRAGSGSRQWRQQPCCCACLHAIVQSEARGNPGKTAGMPSIFSLRTSKSIIQRCARLGERWRQTGVLG